MAPIFTGGIYTRSKKMTQVCGGGGGGGVGNAIDCKKRSAIFPSSAGMSPTKLSLAENN